MKYLALLSVFLAVPLFAQAQAHLLELKPLPKLPVSVASAAPPLTCSTTLGGPACAGGMGSVCVNVTWTASTSQVAGYNLYRANASGAETGPINSSPITGTTFQDNNLPSGATVLYYEATAVNSGGQQSAYSNESCAQIPVPPAAPTNLQATPQ